MIWNGDVQMNWKTLLKPYRLGCPKELEINHDRGEFQRDFDRVIFSAAFRRLQGKTQVVPIPETDIIHTRLTHSLEAASVGRSLGTIVGNYLKDEGLEPWELGALVCVACLSHDIGNPPLGHSGEDAIAEFYDSSFGKDILQGLSDEQKTDFQFFEGNAMGLHILTYSNPHITNVKGGLSLTYPTLATFTKYPRPSLVKDLDKTLVSEKKPGILFCDLKTYNDIAEELQIDRKISGDRWYRHPLAFLTEAADDICYCIIDFEDGFKHGLIDYDEIHKYFTEIAMVKPGKRGLSDLDNIIDNKNRIGYLRAKAINSLIYQVVDVFIDKHSDILGARFDDRLCKHIESKSIFKEIIDISQNRIYCNRPILQVEAAGFKILPGLLEIFLSALSSKNKNGSKKILSLLPREYLFDFDDQKYEAILSITTYVAGMTDTFAIDTYRNLTGIQLPNY